MKVEDSDELVSWINDKLVTEGSNPTIIAEIVADELPLSETDVLEYIKKAYTLTESPGRRSFKYCLRCNPYLNGSHGKDGTEAVAKHNIPNEDGMEQSLTGWEGLCYDCAEEMANIPDTTLQPLDGHENLDIFTNQNEDTTHDCNDPEWHKISLVTENEGFDWVECKQCGIQAKRHSPTNFEVVGYNKR